MSVKSCFLIKTKRILIYYLHLLIPYLLFSLEYTPGIVMCKEVWITPLRPLIKYSDYRYDIKVKRDDIIFELKVSRKPFSNVIALPCNFIIKRAHKTFAIVTLKRTKSWHNWIFHPFALLYLFWLWILFPHSF